MMQESQKLEFPGGIPDSIRSEIEQYLEVRDGAANDPVWLVLAVRPSNDVLRVQSKYVADGSVDDNIVILNANWQAFRLDIAADISGNTAHEIVVIATRQADGVRRIHIKDHGTGMTTVNIAP